MVSLIYLFWYLGFFREWGFSLQDPQGVYITKHIFGSWRGKVLLRLFASVDSEKPYSICHLLIAGIWSVFLYYYSFTDDEVINKNIRQSTMLFAF